MLGASSPTKNQESVSRIDLDGSLAECFVRVAF